MTEPATSRPAAPARNEIRPDIAAYNDEARALDRLIFAQVMTSEPGLFWTNREDRMLVASARSILVDAEAALLRDDHPAQCRLGLLAAAEKIRFITDVKKRQPSYGNIQRQLDSRVRAELDAVRAGCELLARQLETALQRPLGPS